MKERDIFEDAFRPFWACGGEGGLSGRAALPQRDEASSGDACGEESGEIPICGMKASGDDRENLGRTPESEITERRDCGGSGRSCGRRIRGRW